MVREKVSQDVDVTEITYDAKHWAILEEKRVKAATLLALIPTLSPIVYGSVARGDVSALSDIDILIPFTVDEYQLLPLLEKLDAGPILSRQVVQATPRAALKAVITFSSELSLSFPLVPLLPREQDFYKFGGSIDLTGLRGGTRVPGINKKLLLIEPNPHGHSEMRINRDIAPRAAKVLGISVEAIHERIRVLERRDKVGRTGIFLTRHLSPDESFASVLREIISTSPGAKRRIMDRR